ncbi:hypothetical protein FNV43_RR18608 [Rhamnella rubrinervis]|uniref:Uncharacterized protein n=1 Tax=Rhamnella rubrinervis TaxID=2594499 RepID=A0A8K0E670_9ROSA|nr:hypothetical protein FNV43_RR18608 [Rhamnella rubrinervis]
MSVFLQFFYKKLDEEGRYQLYARKSTKLLKDAKTSDKNWKDRYFFVKSESSFDPDGSSKYPIRLAWTERGPKLIFPYATTLNISARLPTSVEQNGVRHNNEPRISPKRNPLREKNNSNQAPPLASKDKDKAALAPKKGLTLENSSSIRTDPKQAIQIVDSLMSRHDRVDLNSMSLEKISQEVEQNALKLAQSCKFLSERWSKANASFKKKTAALSNATTTIKALEEENLLLKKTSTEANIRAEFKAGETNWHTPEPSDDEEGSDDPSEISSEEDEAGDDTEGE